LGDGYGVVVCASCGAAFADRAVPQEQMDRYYAEQSKYTREHEGGAESEWDMRRFEATADQVCPCLASREARILDIGCATGGLLSVLKGRGFANVQGFDPSPACAEAARRRHAIPVATGSLGSLAKDAARFDLILLLGVLEHLREPKAMLGTVASLLGEGGSLYCAVPDAQGLPECAGAPYQQFSIEHVNFFSSKSLARMLGAAGYRETRSWRWQIEWRPGALEPIASGLFVRGPGAAAQRDDVTLAALQRYVEYSGRADASTSGAIDQLLRGRRRLLVWGAGTMTRRLLATSRLGELNIAGFVDSNPNLQGSTLAGFPVLAPADIAHRDEAILICSKVFEVEIRAMIREKLGIGNPVITL
jgi:2-polyprenyl-3-methyl-5-hydroxy-6-metoxy-1,4-benzoquinol methylase